MCIVSFGPFSEFFVFLIMFLYILIVKTCGKAENDEAKGVPGRRGVTEGDGR